MIVGLIGANGQLGTDLAREFTAQGDSVLALNHDSIEIADAASVERALDGGRADVIVNTAAMLNVDRCELEPQRAFSVNALGARNVALACRRRNLPLVHFSTDYVFDGAKRAPYVETDLPLPLQVYGNSKLAGEYLVRATLSRHLVLRVCGLYGHTTSRAKGTNFVQTMLRLGREQPEVRVVDDEVLCPTFTRDVARQAVRLVHAGAHGLYHAGAHGTCSWYRFAQEIWKLAKLPAALSVAAPDELAARAPRPKYSALDNLALRNAGLDLMRPWQDGLRQYFEIAGS